MLIQIIILILLIIANALFVAMEMAFITINDLKIEQESKNGNKKAMKIYKMLKEPNKFLATIQICITFAGFLSSAIAASSFSDILAPKLHSLLNFISLDVWNIISVIIITIILSILMLIFGELVPKRYAMKYSYQVAYKTINILNVISKIFLPLVIVLMKLTKVVSHLFGIKEFEEETVTEEEVKMILDASLEDGSLQKYEHNYIHNILKFNDIRIKDIMTNKKDIIYLNIPLNYDEVLKKFQNSTFSKLPVLSNNEIIGVVYSKDVLKNKSNIKMHNIIKINSTNLIYQAFDKLKQNKTTIALVIEKNKYIGIVTMKDILEEIVGDLKDEFDT